MKFEGAPVISRFINHEAYMDLNRWNRLYVPYVYLLDRELRWSNGVIIITEQVQEAEMPQELLEYGWLSVITEIATDDGILLPVGFSVDEHAMKRITEWDSHTYLKHSTIQGEELYETAASLVGKEKPFTVGEHNVDAKYLRDVARALHAEEQIAINIGNRYLKHYDESFPLIQLKWERGTADIAALND